MITKEELADKFYYIAMTAMRIYYPDEYVPNHSVSIGNVYESIKSYSCQIRFLNNGIIMKLRYNKDNDTVDNEIYRLEHFNKAEITDEKTKVYIEDHITEILVQNQEIQNKEIEKENKKKAKEEEKAKKQSSKPRTMKKRKKEEVQNDNN